MPKSTVAQIDLSLSIGHPNVFVVPSDRPGYLKVKVTSGADTTADYVEYPLTEGPDDTYDVYTESRRKGAKRETYHYIAFADVLPTLINQGAVKAVSVQPFANFVLGQEAITREISRMRAMGLLPTIHC